MDSPCHAMAARRLARRLTALYDTALDGHGLTIGQFGVLAQLRRSEAIGVAALAERLANDASTCSRLLKPLAANGLLTIERDPADGRARQVRLTDAGAVRFRAARAGWAAAQAAVAERLGEERLAALRGAIDDAFPRLSA